MSISFETSGSFKNTEGFLTRVQKLNVRATLNKYGRQGVAALAAATPVDTGLTAESWTFDVQIRNNTWSLIWKNAHLENGTPVVIWLQYGHATGTGGWVQGRDFINPAIKPIFDKIAEDVWKAVKSV